MLGGIRKKFKYLNHSFNEYSNQESQSNKLLPFGTTVKEHSINQHETTTTATATTNRFSFMDSYRGSLVVVALMSRCKIAKDSDLVNISTRFSYNYSTCGFLVLTGFLLTYRLLVDLDKANTLRNFTLALSTFFFRRLLRAYFLFVIFYPVVTAMSIAHVDYEPNYWKVYTFDYPGDNHFWPIASAARYCLFIPIFCILVCLLKPFRVMIVLASLVWTIYDRVYNVFDLTPEDFEFYSPSIISFKTHFVVYFAGSQAALAFFLIEHDQSFLKRIETRRVQQFMRFLSLMLAMGGLETKNASASFYWASCLLLTLLSQPNSLTKLFEGSWLLKSLGRYSLSFYLLYPIFIFFVHWFFYRTIREVSFDGYYSYDLLVFVFSLLFGYVFIDFFYNKFLKSLPSNFNTFLKIFFHSN